MDSRYTLEDIIDLVTKGKLDIDILNKTMEELRNYSYTYLSNLQESLVDIHKIHLTYEDFVMREPDKYRPDRIVNIKFSFIHNNYRDSFFKNPLYNKKISNSDIENHKKIFVYKFFVFIDGNIDITARISCKEYLTTFHLNKYIMTPGLKELFKPGCSIDILIVRDAYVESKSLRARDLREALMEFNFKNNSVKIDDNFSIFAIINQNDKYSMVKMYDCIFTEGIIRIPTIALMGIDDNKFINVSFIMIPCFLEQKSCSSNKYIDHSETKMPIPINNLITFRKRNDGSILIDNSITITKKYPEIFEFTDKDETETIYANIYYCNDVDEFIYISEAEMYSKLNNVIELYENNLINIDVDNFNPIEFEYNFYERLKVFLK